jgi:hypothetical protein
VEELLGFKLLPTQIVHHIDNNPANNSPNNLVVCENQKYHMLIHARTDMLNRGQDPKTQGFCGVCKKVLPRENFCQNKRMILGIHNRCRICQAKYKKETGLDKRKPEHKWRDMLGQQYRRAKTNKVKKEISWLL